MWNNIPDYYMKGYTVGRYKSIAINSELDNSSKEFKDSAEGSDDTEAHSSEGDDNTQSGYEDSGQSEVKVNYTE